MATLRCSCPAPQRVSSWTGQSAVVMRRPDDPFCEIHGDPLAASRVHTTPMSEELIAALVEAVKESDSP